MPLKSVHSGEMIDLHSVVALFHKTKWTELANTHKIDRVLGENTISYSTIDKYFRMFVSSTKETGIPIVPESEGDFRLTVCRYLAQNMRWKLQHLKWVPYSLCAMHFKAPGRPSQIFPSLLFSIVHSLMSNAGCLFDRMLTGSRPTWKERRKNLFDVLAMACIGSMGMPAEQFDQRNGQ
jgi:hypothetical protein